MCIPCYCEAAEDEYHFYVKTETRNDLSKDGDIKSSCHDKSLFNMVTSLRGHFGQNLVHHCMRTPELHEVSSAFKRYQCD